MNPINGNTLHTHTWPLMTPTVVDRHGVTEMKKHVVDLCYLNDFVLAAFDYIRFYSKRCAKHDSTIIITSITRLLGVKFRSMSYWQVTKVKQTGDKKRIARCNGSPTMLGYIQELSCARNATFTLLTK